MSRGARGRTLREVLERKRELAERAAVQRGEVARRAEELAGPLSWVDRGIALAFALRRGAGIVGVFSGLRAVWSRFHPKGG